MGVTHKAKMGNAAFRQRMKAADFDYLAKNTAYLRPEIVETKFGELKEKYPSGEMKPEDFRDVFQLAFPECHHAALIKLSEFLTNKDGTIPMSSMLMLLYLLCDGQTDDNLATSSTSLTEMATALLK